MDLTEILIVLLVGMVAGFFNTVAGGGSLLTLPILIQFLHMESAVANATNRVGLFIQNIITTWNFRRRGVHVYPFNMWLALATVPGGFIGAWLAVEISGGLFNKILAIVMLVVIVITIINPAKRLKLNTERMTPRRRALSIILFFLMGFYGGFIQAGIGFLIIITLALVNGLSLLKANSIKVAVILAYTAAALAVFFYKGVVDIMVGLVLAGGTSIGGFIGSQWAVKVGDKWIRRVLIVAVLALAIRLWFFS